MKLVLFAILWFPMLGIAQSTNGILFEKNLSWQEIKAKAKVENKYIFVDAFTTWCKPCKVMEQDVFTDETLGQKVNHEFISVQVQMDKTNKDNDRTKQWYSVADNFTEQYKIAAFPTFLFFTPDGILAHKDVGYISVPDFINLTNVARDPQKQYYILLNKYYEKDLEIDQVAYLVRAAKQRKDHDIANVIAKDYLDNYLYKLSKRDLFTKENLEFIGESTNTSKENGFRLFVDNRKQINRVLGQGKAEQLVMKIIRAEEISPYWNTDENKDKRPDWTILEKKVVSKYGAIGKEVIEEQKLGYYLIVEDWDRFAKYFLNYYQNRLSPGVWDENNMSWKVFEHVDDQKVLDCAIKLMDAHKEEDIAALDTYANLLYKTGRINEALVWEEKALQKAITQKNKDLANTFQSTIEKMRNNIPTWTVK